MLTWVEVDLNAIKQNIKAIKNYVRPHVGLAAVIKSDAYGHGIEQVARVASRAGAEFLCVDNIVEAKKIKRKRPKILILGGVESEDLPWTIKNDIRFGIYDLTFAKKVERAAAKINKRALVHIKIDTGMHRLGFEAEDSVSSIKYIIEHYKHIKVEGVWSHFADSGSAANKKYTCKQIEKFKHILSQLKTEGINTKYQHLCNSSGMLDLPQAHYNLVRCGLIIYGIFPSSLMKKRYSTKLKIKPALSFKSRIVGLKRLDGGERIGYGLTYRLKKVSTIAVLAVGYKDGYGRNLSNSGSIIIKEQKCPVVGRICMRMTMVDASSAKNTCLDDVAVLIGGNGRVRIEADEVAQKMGTISEEVLTRISESVPRIYKN